MTCTSCGDKPKNSAKGFPRAVVEINNPESLVLLRKVVIPVSMGTEEDVPPVIGKYFNVLLQYEANGHIYLYSSDGIPTAIEANIPQEVLDRIEDLEIEDTRLHNEIAEVASDLADETTAREAADSALSSSIESLSSSLSAETAARELADAALSGRIDTVSGNLATETANRISADEDLQANITAEATARANADTALGTRIDGVVADLAAEASARTAADTALGDRITAEETARANADTALDNRVTAIEEKIPAQASAQNQLADKGFVNSSIATNTANFIGTFNSVAELEAYTGTVTNNDYAFVIVTDAQGNTAYDRYKYNGDTQQWLFEYELNNSSFTAAQWAAINSGITSGDVTKLAGLANIRTIGTNLNLASDGTLSATDTTYSAGSGLNLTGTTFSVDTSTIATQSDLTAGLATKQDTLTAGANIQINNNVISATDTTYTHFTGATASTDGAQGLVPGPLAGDEDKFLKADGTWGTAGGGGGGFVELTSADYNYPVGNPNGIHPMYLADGVYKLSKGLVFWNISSATTTSTSETLSTDMYLVVSQVSANDKRAYYVYPGGSGVGDLRGNHLAVGLQGRPNQFDYIKSSNTVVSQNIVDGLTSTSTVFPLSANQGKVLKGLIDAISQSGAGAPTTATVGTVGQLYQDTTNGKLYICTDATNPYVWEEVGAGGGGPTVVQTTGTSTTDVMSQNATTSMVFADPATQYKIKIGAGATVGNSGNPIAIGEGAKATGANAIYIGVRNGTGEATGYGSIAVGTQAKATAQGSVALGSASLATAAGQCDIGTQDTYYGYNSSNYRLLTGLYDPQNVHDAATKGYVDTAIAGAGAAAFTTNEWNALWA